jgi:hypothetical protein
MGHRISFVIAIGVLLPPLFGCLEDFGKIRETDMPRIGDGRQKSQAEPPDKPVDSFNARALWEQYGESVLQADWNCKGKIIKVTGQVRTFDSDERHRYYIGFQVFERPDVSPKRLQTMSAKEKRWLQEGYPPAVICYLDPAEKSRLAEVKKGQTLELVGRCLGRVKDPSGFKDYVIVLDGCHVAP